jgi:hypothetical protein
MDGRKAEFNGKIVTIKEQGAGVFGGELSPILEKVV